MGTIIRNKNLIRWPLNNGVGKVSSRTHRGISESTDESRTRSFWEKSLGLAMRFEDGGKHSNRVDNNNLVNIQSCQNFDQIASETLARIY